MKTSIAASLALAILVLPSCSSLTTAQKAEIQAVAVGAAKGAALSAAGQYVSGQKINPDTVAQAALAGAVAAQTTTTPAAQ